MKINFYSLFAGVGLLIFGVMFFFDPEFYNSMDKNRTYGYLRLFLDFLGYFGSWLPGLIVISFSFFLLSCSITKNPEKILENGRFYFKSTHKYIIENNIAFKEIENAILHGKKKKKFEGYNYRWVNNDGLIILVFVNREGEVLKVII